MRAGYSRQIFFFSIQLNRPNTTSFSWIQLIPFCLASIPEIKFHRACHVSKKPSRPFYLLLLKASASLPIVCSIQAHACKSGFRYDVVFSTAVLSSLAEFGDISSARKLFDEMPSRDVAAWNAMLSGYFRNRLIFPGMSLFQLMVSSSTKLNSFTLTVLLQLCGNFDDQRLGRAVHGYACRHFELEDIFLGNSLIVYYSKFDCLDVSASVFESMLTRDIVSWNAMISACMINGSPFKSLELLWMLRKECFHPDHITLEIALQACARIGAEVNFEGLLIHGLIIRLGFKMNLYAENCLLIMYCKCGMVESGQSLFDVMEMRNAVSWNALISGYVYINFPWKALDLFLYARSFELEISSDLLASAFQAARLMGERRELVMSLHGLVILMGFDSDICIRSLVISAYGDTGDVEYARRSFHYFVLAGNISTVCWNTMLSVYLHHGYFSEAVELIGNEIFYDTVSLVNILSLCVSKLGLMAGKAVHGYTIRNKFESDVFVSTSLLELYITYGLLHSACKMFSLMPCRNIVSWNTMITGCARIGSPSISLKLFYDMWQKDGFMPDATSVVGAIEAISYRGIENERKFIHDYVIKKGFIDDEFVATCLISMHSRFLDFSKANLVFDRACKLNIVIWNAMISEYSYHGLMNSAISAFRRMKINGMAPDSVTLLCLLQGCIIRDSLNGTSLIHAIISKSGYDSDVYLGSALINAYSKCGDLARAWQVFDNLDSKTIVSWNSMIHCYGIHGNLEEAGSLFLQMQESGLHPTAITFLILISACSHAGDVDKSLHYLDLMTKTHSLNPGEEHLSGFIGLLGRSGLVTEANELLVKLPIEPAPIAWGAFVGACRFQGNLKMALKAAQNLLEMEPLHQGYHTSLPIILAESGKWMEASFIRSMADKVGHKKEKAWSKVETLL